MMSDNLVRIPSEDDEDWEAWGRAVAKARRDWSGYGSWDDLPRKEKLPFVRKAFNELHPPKAAKP